MKSYLSMLNCPLGEAYRDYGPFILRVVVGVIFLVHGLDKLNRGLESTAGFLNGLGFPLATLFAVLLIAAEVLGGVALIVGALTHFAAKVATIVAAVALFTVHLEKGFSVRDGGYEYILLLLASSVTLALIGPGALSVDGYCKQRQGRT